MRHTLAKPASPNGIAKKVGGVRSRSLIQDVDSLNSATPVVNRTV